MDASAELSFLNCYICFEILKKPKMCPACSKIACEKCLRSWVEERRPECPHCRKTMLLSSFAECERLVSEFKHLLKAMDSNEKTKERCTEHKIQMIYYCQDCEEAICSDCSLFGVKHKDHRIIHLRKIYQTLKNKILNELTQYDQKIESYRQNGYQIKVEMQNLVMEIGERKDFIEKYFVAIIERLEEEFKEKQEKIADKYDSNTKEIEFLESFRENIYRQLESSSEAELIHKCEELIGYIQSVFDKGPEFEPEEYKFDTINEIVPKYNEFLYTLKNYEELSESVVYSDPYVNNSLEWRLKIYPRGNGQARGNFLSVFLEMSKGYVNGNKYEYKIELVSPKLPKHSMKREYSSNFDIGECWGYNQFILLEELKEEFLTEDGSLIFKVSVRNPSYRSLVRDQHSYIRVLEEKLAKQQQATSQPLISSQPQKLSGTQSRKSLPNEQGNPSLAQSGSRLGQLGELSRTNRQRIQQFLMGYSGEKKKILEELERQHERLQIQEHENQDFLSDHTLSQEEIRQSEEFRAPRMIKIKSSGANFHQDQQKVESPREKDENQDNYDQELDLSREQLLARQHAEGAQRLRQQREEKQVFREKPKQLKKIKEPEVEKIQSRRSNCRQHEPSERMGLSMVGSRMIADEDLGENSMSVSIDLSNGSRYLRNRGRDEGSKKYE